MQASLSSRLAGIPSGLTERIEQALPYPDVFRSKLEENVIPVMRRKTLIDSWRGVFGTTKYAEGDKGKVIEVLERLLEDRCRGRARASRDAPCSDEGRIQFSRLVLRPSLYTKPYVT
ncbi:hypothetical protein DRO57_01995 [Candidatus Bathyarchaeota archaeon]|nr:MAG: hypothetical protein DRO57_01995 [Candidatus Bathyarchaeota archaeon]